MKKYTIILTHYNQFKYIRESIDSILMQSYGNIELIIIDDCSSFFDKKELEDYINSNKKDNIVDFKIIINEENLGTTKSLNKAIKESTGDYIELLAADDALYDKNVITRFVEAFEKTNELIISGQCLLCGSSLNDVIGKSIDASKALKYNNLDVKKQYLKMVRGCYLGSGATAYDSRVFKELGLFNEKYKLVEDWSYWLYVLKNGYKIWFENFIVFLHRDGGVSHNDSGVMPPHVEQYYNDILNVYMDLVFSDFNNLDLKTKINVMNKFRYNINYLKLHDKKVSHVFENKYKEINDSFKNFKNKSVKGILDAIVFKLGMICFRAKDALSTPLVRTSIVEMILMALLSLIIFTLFSLDYKYICIYIIIFAMTLLIYKTIKVIKRRLFIKTRDNNK